ncbi:MAG TPA: ribosome assembly RNA-binding protein YhbY [Roseiflexaceae bacterium]|nr:ribosome assembly RNA-binding protein YhbY [Roseiflexaceae bacterium]
MTALTKTQREYLRKQAHDLKPIVQVGKNGLSDNLISSVDQALDAHELIKVKYQDFKEEKRELTDELVGATGATLIAIIGNIAILYREQPDPELRKVALPAAY